MTKIEKEIVAAALSEYAFNHQKAADRAGKQKDFKMQSEQHANANIAAAILEYWKDVINMQCGTVKI